jgi:hypothetical protein
MRVVIGRDQDVGRLDPVHADQQPRALAQPVAHRAEQIDRVPGVHVADRRAGEEAELGEPGDLPGSGSGRRKSASTG